MDKTPKAFPGVWLEGKRQRRFIIQPRVGDEGAYPGFGE
jgi:hypothetical protein